MASWQALAEANRFVKLPPTLITYNSVSMATLMTPAGMPTFTSETSTAPQIGAGKYVISVKRRTWDEYLGSKNRDDLDEVIASEPERASLIAGVKYSTEEMAIVGIGLGAVGLLLGLLALIVACAACCKAGATTKPRSVEIPARDLATPAASADKV